jgi:cephalosporin hydroxylase
VTARADIRRAGQRIRWLEGEAIRVLKRATRPLVYRAYFNDLVDKSGNFGDVCWLGHPIWQNVLDLWSLQEAIAEIQPALLVETGTNRGGSAMFYAHLFDLLGHGRVITVDVQRMHELEHPRVEFLLGSSLEHQVLERMRQAARSANGPVMVVLDSDHAEAHVTAELAAYADLVTPGSLLLAQDGIIDVLPRFAHARPGPLPAIKKFLAARPDFEVDARWDRRFLVTHHPSGWLHRR